MAGEFEIPKDKAGKFRFPTEGRQRRMIAVSEAYESKATAKRGTSAKL